MQTWPQKLARNAKETPNVVCVWEGESGNVKNQYLNSHVWTLYTCGAVALWDTGGIHLVPLRLGLALREHTFCVTYTCVYMP